MNTTMDTLIKKILLPALIIAGIAMAVLSSGITDAKAGGWGKKKFHLHFHKPYHYGYHYNYRCKPKYRKIWVWSPRHGRKIKRFVRVGKWCGNRYYNYY